MKAQVCFFLTALCIELVRVAVGSSHCVAMVAAGWEIKHNGIEHDPKKILSKLKDSIAHFHPALSGVAHGQVGTFLALAHAA